MNRPRVYAKSYFRASKNLRHLRMKNKKTEILIETRERTLIRWIEKEVQMFCPLCGLLSSFVLPEQAAMETGATVRDIFQLVEKASVHFIETSEGLTLVCLVSLQADHQTNVRVCPN